MKSRRSDRFKLLNDINMLIDAAKCIIAVNSKIQAEQKEKGLITTFPLTRNLLSSAVPKIEKSLEKNLEKNKDAEISARFALLKSLTEALAPNHLNTKQALIEAETELQQIKKALISYQTPVQISVSFLVTAATRTTPKESIKTDKTTIDTHFNKLKILDELFKNLKLLANYSASKLEKSNVLIKEVNDLFKKIEEMRIDVPDYSRMIEAQTKLKSETISSNPLKGKTVRIAVPRREKTEDEEEDKTIKPVKR